MSQADQREAGKNRAMRCPVGSLAKQRSINTASGHGAAGANGELSANGQRTMFLSTPPPSQADLHFHVLGIPVRVHPFFWLVATPETALILLGAGSLIGGCGSAAALNAATKLVTRVPPAQKRASYIAVSSAIGNLAGGLGVVLAGALLQLVTDRASADFLTLSGNGFRGLFVLSLLLRLGSTLLLVPRIREKTRERAGG